MLVANFTEFRTNLKIFLDKVEEDGQSIIIKRGSGKGAVVISLDEYNSIMETVHLLSSKANATRLFDSIRQIEKGKKVKKSLLEK
ncbi:MAG: type II toxin-antitoxin system prevent-host-death family antitoxin [Ignavibacteriales bacterium]|nr:type II toxin-antitoxin system prevent-host-death family antitoxin [Ignavibacteriales bacterium]